eukprot:1154778-Pelagomonas_calceolata.AAC.2
MPHNVECRESSVNQCKSKHLKPFWEAHTILASCCAAALQFQRVLLPAAGAGRPVHLDIFAVLLHPHATPLRPPIPIHPRPECAMRKRWLRSSTQLFSTDCAMCPAPPWTNFHSCGCNITPCMWQDSPNSIKCTSSSAKRHARLCYN